MTLDIPDRSASAEDVRRFIADVLVSDYDTDRDFAVETARAWRIGHGAELHDARKKYFEGIFGVEVGFCLYRSVLEARDKQWQSSHIGILFKWCLFASPVLAVWTLSRSRSAPSDTPSFPLLLHGALLTSYAYLRPKNSYVALAMGLLSFGVYFAVLLFRW